MAKSKGKNRSQSIREYLMANPDSKAKEVVEALAKSGIKTNEGDSSLFQFLQEHRKIDLATQTRKGAGR